MYLFEIGILEFRIFDISDISSFFFASFSPISNLSSFRIFERVVVTSKEQCPETNEDLTKSGTYETWFIPAVDNNSFVHEFQTNIFFNFKYTNSTEYVFTPYASCEFTVDLSSVEFLLGSSCATSIHLL
jgi:hypothetical protein